METTRNLTLFLDQSGSLYYIITDIQGRYTYANHFYRKSFFPLTKDILDDYFYASVYSDDMTAYQQAFEACMREPGKAFMADLKSSRPDGTLYSIRWEFRAVVENGSITGVQGLGTDTTESKKAVEEVAETQQKLVRERYLLRTLIDHLPDYIYVKDTESRYIITNKAKVHLLGARSEDDTIGKTLKDFLPPTLAEEHLLKDRASVSTGKPITDIEEYMVDGKGNRKWLLTSRIPLKNDGNEVIGLVGVSRDISDRKSIEESLRNSIERFKIVSKATNDAIWDWDLRDDLVWWSESVVSLFGYSLEEIGNDPKWWEKHIHPEDRERVVVKISNYIGEGIESWQDEYRFICADGTYKALLDRGYLLLDADHKPYRMIGAMMDISERKNLQNELASHMISRQRQITEATILAQERERGELGRELHDNINQILTTTKMYLDMAMTEKDISEELTAKSHENISNVIEEIRILSKSLVPPSLGDIGLKAAITEMINNLKFSQKMEISLRTNGISKVDIPGNVQLMVFRIVQEQVNNILKHAKATKAEIKVNATKEMLSVSISDNGVGFDPKKRMKGIGLMNITSRAELHNGNVEIISSPGNGCALKLAIPL